MKTVYFLLFALAVAGCSSSQPARIDAGLLQLCPPIPPVPEQVDMGELLLMDIELAGMYKECAAGKRGLVEALRGI